MASTNIHLQSLTLDDLGNDFNNVNRLIRDILTANTQQGTQLHSLALTSRFNNTQTVAEPEPLIKLLNEEIDYPTGKKFLRSVPARARLSGSGGGGIQRDEGAATCQR